MTPGRHSWLMSLPRVATSGYGNSASRAGCKQREIKEMTTQQVVGRQKAELQDPAQ